MSNLHLGSNRIPQRAKIFCGKVLTLRRHVLPQEKRAIYRVIEKGFWKVAACLENWPIANGRSQKSVNFILLRETRQVAPQRVGEIHGIKLCSQFEEKFSMLKKLVSTECYRTTKCRL